MSGIKVYDIGQWFKCGDGYGFIVDVDLDREKRGYQMQWVNLWYNDADDIANEVKPVGHRERRKTWIRPESLADKRYVPCANPCEDIAEPEQSSLTLDVDAVTNAILRDMVIAGDKARDALRAKGIVL